MERWSSFVITKQAHRHHHRRGLLLSFFYSFVQVFIFIPVNIFPHKLLSGKCNSFFSIFFLFDEDVFLSRVVSVDAKVPSFCMNMAITRFTVSKFMS